MSAITRVLTSTDPARDLEITLDERAEAELAILLGPEPSPAPSPAPARRPRASAPRWRPVLVTGVVAAVVVASTVAVLVAAPSRHRDVGGTPPSPAPTAPSPSPSAVELTETVWRVDAAAGEGADTWLRFGGHDVRVIRATDALEFEWRAQGDQLLFSPDDYVVGLGGSKTVQWLEDSTAFRPDGSGFDLVDVHGRVTARLVAAGDPPAAPVAVDSIVRNDLTDARPGPVRRIAPTALRGAWQLEGVSRTDAWVTFHSDGTWITTERCEAAGGPETDTGGYRLLDSGVLLATAQTGQALACQDSHADGASVSTLAILLRGRSVRIDGSTATIYDSSGALLGRLIRF